MGDKRLYVGMAAMLVLFVLAVLGAWLYFPQPF